MKVYSQVLMILSYLLAGVWVEQMVAYFYAGNTVGGLRAILPVLGFMVLGSLNLMYVKLDAKKETK